MKTFARIGAIGSFCLFSLSAVLCFRIETGEREATVPIILGSCLLGFGLFLGTLLWVVGEKWGAKHP
jgi:hypothetical protein